MISTNEGRGCAPRLLPNRRALRRSLEARKRKISYGQLVSTTPSYEQQEIVRQYCIEQGKKGTAPEKIATKTKKKRS